MFKVGDRIECVNITSVSDELKLGEVYTAKSFYKLVDGRLAVVLKEVNRHYHEPGFLTTRFVLSKAALPINYLGEFEYVSIKSR